MTSAAPTPRPSSGEPGSDVALSLPQPIASTNTKTARTPRGPDGSRRSAGNAESSMVADRRDESVTQNREQLESAAVVAHARGDTWATFWRRYGPLVIALEPHDRERFHSLVRRLPALVTAGDTHGMLPAGDPAPWEANDVPLGADQR